MRLHSLIFPKCLLSWGATVSHEPGCNAHWQTPVVQHLREVSQGFSTWKCPKTGHALTILRALSSLDPCPWCPGCSCHSWSSWRWEGKGDEPTGVEKPWLIQRVGLSFQVLVLGQWHKKAGAAAQGGWPKGPTEINKTPSSIVTHGVNSWEKLVEQKPWMNVSEALTCLRKR